MRTIILGTLLAAGVAAGADDAFRQATEVYMHAQQGQDGKIEYPALAGSPAGARGAVDAAAAEAAKQ
jgi:hypothetical protein